MGATDSMPRSWSAQLVGGLQVRRPDGTKVYFRTRKCGGLLAMLILARGSAMERTTVAQALWPDADRTAQAANLRKAIELLRKSLLDEGLFFSSRNALWIDTVRLECPDLELIGAPSKECQLTAPLLPEMTEPWFDGLRSTQAPHGYITWQSGLGLGKVDIEVDRGTAVLNALDWAAQNKPAAALVLSRELRDMIQAADPLKTLHLLNASLSQASAQEPCYGWALCQKGIAEIYARSMAEGQRILQQALRHAVTRVDCELFAECQLYAVATLTLEGKPDLALQRVKVVPGKLAGSINRASQTKLCHAEALALLHTGRFEPGLSLLSNAIAGADKTVSQFERAHMIGNYAWFHATCGQSEAALDAIVKLRETESGQSWRCVATATLAEAGVALRRGDNQQVVEITQRFIRSADKVRGLKTYLPYAHELASMAFLGQKRTDEATSHWQLAKASRREILTPLTAWDKHRLAPLRALA